MALKAIALNCTRKTTGKEVSSTDKMIGLGAAQATPVVATSYWVGETMGSTDFKDLDRVPDKVAQTAAMLASNAAHLARLLKADAYPAHPTEPHREDRPND